MSIIHTNTLKDKKKLLTENKLIHETSPYLLQHAANPVDWYPWGEHALQKARDENKPIFLSVGYSSCHWCHVMAHESFENGEIAKIMNENFVSIKVDREERPDIDDIYQKVCQMATGQGGWPLSVFLTPDQRPFYVGTYFPPLDSYGRPGFGSLLRQLSQAWKEKPQDIQKEAENIMQTLSAAEKITAPSKIERAVLDEAAVSLLQIADPVYGGFGQAPKFPNASNLAFMFRYSKISKISRFQEFSLRSLKKMARGGIFDQIGGGFHRYSTDARWFLPHFEKMLYDNALLPPVYVEAYQITKDPFFLNVAKKTLKYLIREMMSPEGGFYSAQDADTQGEEGKTYVWEKAEIEKILGKKESDVFCLYFDVTDGGNFEGNTILANNLDSSAVAFHLGVSEDEVNQIVSSCSEKLLQVRSHRAQPGLDDKILTSWNALAITAFAKAFRVTGEQSFLDAAENCVSFIEKNLSGKDGLLRTYKDGKAKLNAYLEDYAYYSNALIDVFEIKPKSEYLEQAVHYAHHLIDHFWDDQSSSFYLTSDIHEKLIIRPKNNYDLSMPSGNSVAAGVLLRLYHLTQEKRFLDICTKIMESQALMAAENPFAFGNLLNVIYMYLQKPTEITMLNKENSEIYKSLTQRFLPESILVTINDEQDLKSLSKFPFFSGKEFPKDKTIVFVCKDFTCSLPLRTLSEIDAHLSR